jgi:perosamine synthetase
LHGITKDAWNRYTAAGSWFYEIQFPGYKYNMTDIAAAIGLVQLQRSGQFLQSRTQIAAMYNEAFADLAELQCPIAEPHVGHAWHLYIIQLQLNRLRISRNQFIEALKKEHVGASVHFIPLHLHPYYRKTFGYRPEDFPQATALFDRIVSLPIYPSMDEEDVAAVIRAVRTVVAQWRR